MLGSVASLGRMVLGAFAGRGRVTLFALSTIRHMLTPPFYIKELGQAVLTIGYFSLPVVGLTALFTGGALALQIYSGGARFNAEAGVPTIVAIGMVRPKFTSQYSLTSSLLASSCRKSPDGTTSTTRP